MPTMEEMSEGRENLKAAGMRVDYIVTHTPPPCLAAGRISGADRSKNQLEAFFEQIEKRVRYEKWFFGSVHADRRITGKDFAVFQQMIPAWESAPKHRFRK